jgi:hypothetical protein
VTTPLPPDQQRDNGAAHGWAVLLGVGALPGLLITAVVGGLMAGGAGICGGAFLGLLALMGAYQAVLDAAIDGSDHADEANATRYIPWIVAGSTIASAAALFLLLTAMCSGNRI